MAWAWRNGDGKRESRPERRGRIVGAGSEVDACWRWRTLQVPRRGCRAVAEWPANATGRSSDAAAVVRVARRPEPSPSSRAQRGSFFTALEPFPGKVPRSARDDGSARDDRGSGASQGGRGHPGFRSHGNSRRPAPHLSHRCHCRTVTWHASATLDQPPRTSRPSLGLLPAIRGGHGRASAPSSSPNR
jgi:hypothetical protein